MKFRRLTVHNSEPFSIAATLTSGRKPRTARWLGVLLILSTISSCYRIPDVWTEGAFLGTFKGYVVLEDGSSLGLSVETQLQTKEEHRYTFTGRALLEGISYRLEGEERSADDRLHYQALPPPRSNLSATFFSDDAAVYRLELSISYGTWDATDKELEGTLYREDVQIGVVRLRKSFVQDLR